MNVCASVCVRVCGVFLEKVLYTHTSILELIEVQKEKEVRAKGDGDGGWAEGRRHMSNIPLFNERK